MRSHRTIFVFTAILFAFSLAGPIPAFGQQNCEHLTKLALPGVAIGSATAIAAGPFSLPSASGASPVNVPAFCRVIAIVLPEVKFELWLPAQWNRKFMGVGNGGLAGVISYAAMVDPLRRGYAVSSTDTGHTNAGPGDGTWALGHMERIVNFGRRGVHLMTEAGKAIVVAFYGGAPAHSYFSGCSDGGQQALTEAQKYPRDYDGIIAGDPANNWTRHYVGGHLWAILAMEGDGYIPAGKVPVIANAVNNACDALDGIKDGVLNDPRLCHFDPAVLQCQAGDGPSCLTSSQVEAVKKLWAGPRDKDGGQIYPGLLPGGEAGTGGWANWITGIEPGKSGHARLGLPAFKYFVFENPDWDFHTFRFENVSGFDSDVDYMDEKLGAFFNAVDPDLRPFQLNNGKLIHYHGWSDPDITPLNSINYYQSVVDLAARSSNHALHDTKDFYRLFMVPGMQHCTGGPGPSRFDTLSALEQWVEHGTAPDKIVASHVAADGSVDRTRPLCPYPQQAQWKGTGSTDDAANFGCALPPSP
jgi:feruloyl esterase